jgi:hypothetical protein
VDILVLVDYSGSMEQEIVALTLRFRDLLAALIDPGDTNGDGRPDHLPVEDLHVGVVTQDLGTRGFVVSTCEDNPDVGDNGCLMHAPVPTMPDCAASYPTFLAFDARDDPGYTLDELWHDYACIGTLPDYPVEIGGCGWEQPLEAMRRALDENAQPGHCNEGFLRPDSLLVLIFLSDEDDCSVRADHPEMFDPNRTDLGNLSTRCHLYPENVQRVEDFVAAFRALRADRPDRLVVGMIVGVPIDTPQCVGSGETLGDCLTVPAMVERLDPANPTQLIPSCNTSMGVAMPPVRLVELAEQLGDAAYIGSCCEANYQPAIAGLTRKIVDHLPAAGSW